ncbi:phage major capsid protein [Paraliobacillus sediminis]|uniref:phage major capsid protein n=1 Tax=Paraliobacillus sediminis TaxID=1885916 RepID=UPI000E3C9FA7|nr:phage major capsid protein [Paraliobacillus sediminis]
MKTSNIQVRSAFANYLVGNINEGEARSLGVNIKGGKALVPKTIADEIIGYVKQENILRKYGKVVKVDGNKGYPVLTGKTTVNINSSERETNEIEVNSIGLTAELLSPVEFDSISRIKKKLLKTSPVSVSDLVIEVIKQEYLEKEIDYMINGTSAKATNTGSLLNKAKVFTPTATEPVLIIKELKNTPTGRVMNKSRWILNKAALKHVEDLTLPNGEAALKTVDTVDGGAKYLLLGYSADLVETVKGSTDTTAVFYFGDLSSFTIQENAEGLEVETLYEKYANLNEIGFKLYNLLDGKLIYSDLEPTVYKLEI